MRTVPRLAWRPRILRAKIAGATQKNRNVQLGRVSFCDATWAEAVGPSTARTSFIHLVSAVVFVYLVSATMFNGFTLSQVIHDRGQLSA